MDSMIAAAQTGPGGRVYGVDFSESMLSHARSGAAEAGAANVDFMTIGQYLQPTLKHAPIARYVTPDEFKELETVAYAKGFLKVSATPLTRSSYHADEDFQALQAARRKSA